MSRHPQSLYAIGKVEKTFGIKGEVIVRPMTESPDRFRKLKRAYLGRQESDVNTLTVEYARVNSRGVRLKFLEIPDRTRAEEVVGSLIFVNEKQLIVPKKGAHFIHEIVGLRVVDENDKTVGVVKDVLRLPAQDVYVIDHDGHEWMIPAVKELIASVDVTTKTMKVRAIEGLINP